MSTAEKKNGRKKFLIILFVVVAVVALIVGGAYYWLDSLVQMTGDIDATDETYSTEDMETLFGEEEPEVDPTTQQADNITSGQDVINILLVGQDKREGQKRQRSDAMILCTINLKTKTLTFTSLMRDLWVYIPDHYNQRLNVPYKLGGFSLLNKTLDYNFGVTADYNVEVDFSGFCEVIDQIGGIDIELTSSEAKYLNKIGDSAFKSGAKWKLQKGMNHLDGAQALAYARIRKIDSDFARTNRQRTVLNCLLEKARDLDAVSIYNVAKAVLPMVNTDLKTTQILGIIMDVAPILGELKVVSQRIPTDKQYYLTSKNGASVIAMKKSQLEANRELLKKTMLGE